jgi:Rieske Fe-S protein
MIDVPTPGASPRRGFLKTLTVVLGSAAALIVAVPGIRYLLYPVRRKVVAGADTPVPVIDVDRLVPGAAPVRVKVTTPAQRDAWATARDVPLGSAWVSRSQDGKLQVLSATCPHLGCSIDYDAAAGQFRCPCHTSAFARDGARLAGPAKRSMDPLDASVEDGKVMVRFARFKLDTSDREEA